MYPTNQVDMGGCCRRRDKGRFLTRVWGPLSFLLFVFAIVNQKSQDLNIFFSKTPDKGPVTMNADAIAFSFLALFSILAFCVYLLRMGQTVKFSFRASLGILGMTLLLLLLTLGFLCKSSPDPSVTMANYPSTLDDIGDVAELKDACGNDVFACDYNVPVTWIVHLVIVLLNIIITICFIFMHWGYYKNPLDESIEADLQPLPPQSMPQASSQGSFIPSSIPAAGTMPHYGAPMAASNTVGFCPSCGNAIVEGVVFCPKCGRDQRGINAPHNHPHNHNEEGFDGGNPNPSFPADIPSVPTPAYDNMDAPPAYDQTS